jgi:alanine dehydrogenase
MEARVNAGLPRMHKEAGERRDFLPDFVRRLREAGVADIVMEDGYGSGMGIPPDAYLAAGGTRFGSLDECLAQDLVAVVRCPAPGALLRLEPGATLLTMLHFATWPTRTQWLAEHGIQAISMDAIVDDDGRRRVEAFSSVGWNGVRAAFSEIAKLHPMFSHSDRRPLRVTCLGAGAVGGHAIRAATRYGDPKLREELVSRRVPGVEVTVADFDLTWHEDYMRSRLERTDLLIDATQRLDHSRPVIPNDWIAHLPVDAVILDLSADTYDPDARPPKTKGVEGIPEGDLDQWVFEPDDPAYEQLPAQIPTANRRVTLSCYAWPGLTPRECMTVYGSQLEPFLPMIVCGARSRPDRESHDGRALARAEVTTWLARSA